MRAGDLDEQLTFRTKAQGRGPAGEKTVTLTDLATVWSEWIPETGSEVFNSARLEGREIWRVRVRHRTDVDRKVEILRLKDSDTYDILSVFDPTGDREELQIMAERRT